MSLTISEPAASWPWSFSACTSKRLCPGTSHSTSAKSSCGTWRHGSVVAPDEWPLRGVQAERALNVEPDPGDGRNFTETEPHGNLRLEKGEAKGLRPCGVFEDDIVTEAEGDHVSSAVELPEGLANQVLEYPSDHVGEAAQGTRLKDLSIRRERARHATNVQGGPIRKCPNKRPRCGGRTRPRGANPLAAAFWHADMRDAQAEVANYGANDISQISGSRGQVAQSSKRWRKNDGGSTRKRRQSWTAGTSSYASLVGPSSSMW